MTPQRPRGADAQGPAVESSVDDTRAGLAILSPDPSDGPLYAALDLGTNSCRMLIAQPKGSEFHVVDSFSKTVQLGVGLEASGRLSRASMGRTIQALRICQQKIEKHQVTRMRLVATEACRRARNAKDFIRQVKRETGLQLEIIATKDEARLAVISLSARPCFSANSATGSSWHSCRYSTGISPAASASESPFKPRYAAS